jgi:ribosomal protein L23
LEVENCVLQPATEFNLEVITICDHPLKTKDMPNLGKKRIIPDEIVMNKIIMIRNQKVMIDRDLAELYGVTTKQLNQQVKRNNKRFPEDFMFQLSEEEKNEVVTNCDHLKNLKFSPNLPFAFTEHGAVMLASVLNSERAIESNIQIIRVFTKMRELLLTHKDILLQLEKMEKKLTGHDEDIALIFEYLKKLLNPPQTPHNKVGFRRKDEKE